jgi:hypothetical protein
MGTMLRFIARYLYTHNPFYVISAALVFYGLRRSFGASGDVLDTWALMASLMSYTALLAATAWGIVRCGGVWEDARSLFILIVLSVLAMSVTFDDMLAANRASGSMYFLVGFGFALAITEGLLHAMQIRLPALYRVPYYLLLGLFFFYPLLLIPTLATPGALALRLRLFGFSPAAGLALLALLPAVRRGPDYVRANGTPWTWPWFPGVLFGVLGFGVCVRAYYLCLSFDFLPGTTSIFDAYFWVPFLFAAVVLLLEFGMVTGNRTGRALAIVAPAILLILSMPTAGTSAAATVFLREMSVRGGSPLFWTLTGVVAFYAMATLRGVGGALPALVLASACFTRVSPQSVDLTTATGLHALALIPLVGVLLWRAILRPSSARVFLCVSGIVAFATIGLRETWLVSYGLAAPIHLLWGAAIVLGATFDDSFARVLRRTAATAFVLAGALAVVGNGPFFSQLPDSFRAIYLTVLTLVAFSGWKWRRGSWYVWSACADLVALCWFLAVRGYEFTKPQIVGIDQLLWGAAFFGVAILISLAKGGAWTRIQSWLRRIQTLQRDTS